MKRIKFLIFLLLLFMPIVVDARDPDEFAEKNSLGKVTCEYDLSENNNVCGGQNLFLIFDDGSGSITLNCRPRDQYDDYFQVRKDNSLENTGDNSLRSVFVKNGEFVCPKQMYVYEKKECPPAPEKCTKKKLYYYISKNQLADRYQATQLYETPLPLLSTVISEKKPINNTSNNNDPSANEIECMVSYLDGSVDVPLHGLFHTNFVFKYKINLNTKSILSVEPKGDLDDFKFTNKLTFNDIIESKDGYYQCKSDVKGLQVICDDYNEAEDKILCNITTTAPPVTKPVDPCEILPQSIKDWIEDTLNLVKYVALALVIVLGVLDFIKAAASGEADQMKKSGQSFLKRIIAVVILFLVPLIVELIINLIELYGTEHDCFGLWS